MSNRLVVKETPQCKWILSEKALSQAPTRSGARLLILFVFQVSVHTCPYYLTRGRRRNSKQLAASSWQVLKCRNLPLLPAARCNSAKLRIAHRPF